MGRRRLGKFSWGVMLLLAAAAGFSGGTVSAGSGGGSLYFCDSAQAIPTPPATCSTQTITLDAVAGQPITEDGFDSGNPVVVEAINSSGNLASGVKVSITVLPLSGELNVQVSGNSSAKTDSTGTVSFPNLTVSPSGYYELVATATPPNKYAAATSPVFLAVGAEGQAPSITNGGTSATVNGNGIVTVSVSVGGFDSAAYNCNFAGYFGDGMTTPIPNGDPVYPVEADVWSNGIAGGGGETVTVTISQATVELEQNNGAAHFQICAASTTDPSGYYQLVGLTTFNCNTPYSLQPSDAPCEQVTDPATGLTFYLWLLPPCSPSVPTECIESITKESGANVVITYLAPPGDMWGGP